MQSIAKSARPKYLTDEKGNKKGIVLNLRGYNKILGLIGDLEDSNDLLRAEREATSFIPYDKFRKTWLKNCQ
jgi:hypothetical protein